MISIYGNKHMDRTTRLELCIITLDTPEVQQCPTPTVLELIQFYCCKCLVCQDKEFWEIGRSDMSELVCLYSSVLYPVPPGEFCHLPIKYYSSESRLT